MKLSDVLDMIKIGRRSKSECENSSSLDLIVKPDIKMYNIPIRCKNIDTDVDYKSANEAAKSEGISRSSVQRMLSGEVDSVKGIRIRKIL